METAPASARAGDRELAHAQSDGSPMSDPEEMAAALARHQSDVDPAVRLIRVRSFAISPPGLPFTWMPVAHPRAPHPSSSPLLTLKGTITSQESNLWVAHDEVQSLSPAHRAAALGSNAQLGDVADSANALDARGRTPLHVAVASFESSVVKALLKLNVDPNVAEREQGFTPLHIACMHGQGDIVKMLAKTKGIDLNPQARVVGTPLHVACASLNWEVAEMLVALGASAAATDSNGRTVLHIAAEMMTFACDVEARVSMILRFLQRGVPIDAAVSFFPPPLIVALLHPLRAGVYVHVCLTLVEMAGTYTQDNAGSTALHIAAGCGNRDVVEILLAQGARVDAVDKDGQTALHRAVRDGRGLLSVPTPSTGSGKDLAQLLLDHGVDSHARDNNGRTALELLGAVLAERTLQRPELVALQVAERRIQSRMERVSEHVRAEDMARALAEEEAREEAAAGASSTSNSKRTSGKAGSSKRLPFLPASSRKKSSG